MARAPARPPGTRAREGRPAASDPRVPDARRRDGRRRAGLLTVLLALPGLLGPAGGGAQPVDPGLLGGVEPRSLGPAGMSGRIAAIDARPGDPDVLYVGAATGGVWKSENGGDTWRPIFDDQPLQGVGAVAVSPANPDLVWVGTGEGNPRNSAGVGAGVYRSLDGGRSWELTGLVASERIHRIVPHPTDPEVAWVAAMGPAWSDGEQRGVYRTTDGGESWEKVLWVNARTGASDLVVDPENPDRLFAGMWEFRRSPWFFESGGPGSGLYATQDGGDTWHRYTAEDGLPDGELGRIGLAVSASSPEVVYALVEAERSALLRSDDGGRIWRTVNDGSGVNPRPFYYTDIRVDPSNPDRVWNLHERLEVSEDGGRTFRTVRSDIHPDLQAMWIDPDDPEHLVTGTDGGVFTSRDRGRSWRFVDNLPVGQFHRVSVDMDVPYNVYGGMQDNGSWRGPSDVWHRGEIRNHDWREVGSGDGFGTRVDPSDPRRGYAVSQEGRLRRFDLRTGTRKDVQPWAPDGEELRFNWNAPLAADPFEPGTVYFGSQFVHRTSSGGESWQILSEDLTTDDPEKQRQDESGGLTADDTGAENHTTLTTIAPSPVERELIWVGSDDGRIHYTRTAGGTWTDAGDRIPDVPDATWVSHIEASKHRAGTAYIVLDDHRRGNWTPYLFRTDDYGESWENLADGRGLRGYVHTMEQDPVQPGLLFAGTEFGLHVSLDGGEAWFPWRHGFPAVPVRSLVVHPRDYDLVIGTHGRGVWILDDVRPLQALARDPSLAERVLHLFEPPPAYVHATAAPDGYHFAADHLFRGEDEPDGVPLTFWAADAGPGDTVDVEVEDDAGRVVRRFRAPARAGLNRTRWDLRREPPGEAAADGDDRPGPRVLPGRYRVRLLGRGATREVTVEVLPDPRERIGAEARQRKQEALLDALELRGTYRRLRREPARVQQGVSRTLALLEGRDDAEARDLREAGRRVQRRAEELAAQVRDARRHLRLVRSLASSFDAPTEAQRIDLMRMEEALALLVLRVSDFLEGPVSDFRARAAEAGLDPLPRFDPPGE